MNQLAESNIADAPASLDKVNFARLAELARKEAGLAISQNKLAMVQTRLAPRLRKLSMRSFDEYLEYVCAAAGEAERHQLISALTTNVSYFFREDHHFDSLVQDIGPDLLKKQKAGEPVRIWSAGCSQGQEPLSIGLALLKNNLILPNADLRILATDIDRRVLKFAQTAEYQERLLKGLPGDMRDQYFENVERSTGTWRPSERLRRLISYRELNLLRDWPMKCKFDVIFCRNVLIYFDQQTQNKLWPKFAKIIAKDGIMYLGHSERVSEPYANLFEAAATTAYKLRP